MNGRFALLRANDNSFFPNGQHPITDELTRYKAELLCSTIRVFINMNIPSLLNPPSAPKKKVERKPLPTLGSVRCLSFPALSPPPAPKKRKVLKKVLNLTPIPLDWDYSASFLEAQILADSGEVREKFLINSPEDVVEETNKAFLERLWELYFPSTQPRNAFEEAYMRLMRDCIDSRLAEL